MRMSTQACCRQLLALVVLLILSAQVEGLQIRLRVKEPIKYQGFTYSGKHWIEGTLVRHDTDTIVLKVSKGGDNLSVPASWVTECQIRDDVNSPWQSTNLPLADTSTLQTELPAATTSETRSAPAAASSTPKRFSYGAIGWGQLRLPKNRHSMSEPPLLPDGETTMVPLIFFGSSTPYGFGWGISWTGYQLEKTARNSLLDVTLTHKYSVNTPAFYLRYDTILGDSDLSPRLGLRGGVALAIIDFELRTTTPDEITIGDLVIPTTKTERSSDDETKLAPYAGLEVLIPLSKTRFCLFGVIEKIWVQHENGFFSDKHVDVGALAYGVGMVFRY